MPKHFEWVRSYKNTYNIGQYNNKRKLAPLNKTKYSVIRFYSLKNFNEFKI